MQRSFDSEILDGDGVPPDVVARAHRGLRLTHTLLGNRAAILRALGRDGPPVRRVLDVGCGHGAMLADIRARLDVDVIGADLKPPTDSPVPIMRADVTRDPLPDADVAISICLLHHLTDEQVVALIRNVGRSCRRFIILDLVRSRIPLTLFRMAAPLVLPPVNVSDGALSIRRAFTPAEFRALVSRALDGGPFRHTVAPFSIRQVADITY
jgi:SAM-dependent methyltransferase